MAAMLGAIGAMLIGVAAIAGWVFDIRGLMTAGTGIAPMRPLAAIAAILSGMVLLLRMKSSNSPLARTLPRLGASAVLFIAAAELFESGTGTELGIDTLVLHDALHRDPALMLEPHPGRLPISAAVCFLLISLAALAEGRSRMQRRFRAVALTSALVLGLAAALGYAYSMPSLQQVGFFRGMSAPVVLAVLLLSAAALAMSPRDSWIGLLVGPRRLQEEARSLLAWVILVPIGIASLAVVGQRAGLYDADFRLVLMTVGTAVALGAALLANLARIRHLQQGQAQLNRQLLASEAQLHLTLSAAAVTPWAWDLKSGLLQFDTGSGLGAILRELRNPLPVAEYFELIEPNDRAAVRSALERAEATGSYECEYRLRLGRRSVDVLAKGRVERDARGHPVRLLGVAIDVTERHMLDAALREAHYKLAIATRAAALGIHHLDVASGRIECDARSCEIWGMPQGVPLCTDDFFGCIHVDDRAEVRASLAHSLRPDSGGHHVAECRIRTRDTGAERWIHATGQVRFENGQGVELIGTVEDVTARKEAERALAASAEVARAQADEIAALYAAAPVGLCVLDRGLRFVRLNERFADLSGVPVEAHLGRTLREVIPGFDEVAEAAMRRVLEGEEVWGIEVAGTRADPPGLMRTWRENWLPLRDRNGEIVGVTISAEDATREKAGEAALRASERRFQTLADGSSVLLWVTDRKGCEFVNRACLEFVGLAPNTDVRGYDWSEYIHVEDREECFEAYRRAFACCGPFMAEYRFRRHDGAWRWLQSQATPRLSEDGKCLGYVGASIDISDRVAAEAGLHAAARQKDQFLAMLAHELRNPLTPIANAATLLARLVGDDPAACGCVTMLNRQTEQLTRLVDDLLDVSRIAQGRITLQQESVEVGEIVDRAVEGVAPLVRERHHRLTITKPPGPCYVRGDLARLVQSLGNLLQNAAKYTDSEGEIRLEVADAGDDLVIRVHDNGAGIHPKLLPHVFDLFVQGDRALDRSQGGLGIGLSIVRNLIEMHGGSVSATSAGVGQGSTFMIRLPRIEMPAARVSSARAGEAPGQRILVVDDNADAADSLAMILRFEGHEVEVVYSALEALEAARRLRPDVVLLDIGLPQLDGYEVARRLRAMPELDAMRLIALTGYGQPEDRERTRLAGFDEHLVKPADIEELREVLAEVCCDG